MVQHDVTWTLHNQDWTLTQHINRLAKLLLRNSPDEYVIEKIVFTFQDGTVETYHVNRRLDHERRKEIKKYLSKKEKELAFFYVQFINFNCRANIKFALSGLAPFEKLDLIGENTPNWLHEMVNRKFNSQISWRHKLWSFLYNHRPFPNSLMN